MTATGIYRFLTRLGLRPQDSVPLEDRIGAPIRATTVRECPARAVYCAVTVLLTASIAVCTAMASEYHGTVKTAGLPVPGVTLTAVQGDKKVVTTTDERGVFSFADLADGTWTIEVEMLGFAKLTREVGVAHDAPAPEMALTILSEAALLASLEPSQAEPAADRLAAEPPAAKPAPVASAAASASAPRNPPAGARPAPQSKTAFQRVTVSQSAATSTIATEGAIKTEEIADLTQSAANSFIVQGSMSSAAGLPQQNDWGMGDRKSTRLNSSH